MNRTVIWLTARQLFVRSRVISSLVIAVIPFIIVLAYEGNLARAVAQTGKTLTPQNVSSLTMQSGKFLVGMYRDFAIGTLLPLVAIVFGTTAFGTEVGDGTIVYLLTKPAARWRVVLSKYLVAALATSVVMAIAIIAPWTLENHAAVPFNVAMVFSAGAAVGAFLYCAMFLALGLYSKRALVFGLVYIVLVEFTLSRSVAGAQALSVRELVLTATAKIGEGNRWVGPGNVTMDTVWFMGTVFLVGSLLYAWQRYHRFELAEKL
jgi:ABC-2 type transport system permease protein